MHRGFSGSPDGKESACNTGHLVRKIPWRKKRLLIPVFLPGEFQGQRREAVIVHGVTKN